VLLLATMTATPVSAQAATPTPPPNTTVTPNTGTTVAPATTNASGNSTLPPGGTTGAPSGTEESGTASAQSIEWYHVTAGVLGLFVIVGGACYVTLMWQQNAIRNYKNGFEAMVKKIGLKRHDLAEKLREEREAGLSPRRHEPEKEDLRGAFAAGASRDDGAAGGAAAAGAAAGAGAAGAGGSTVSGGDMGGPLLSAPVGLGVGRIHTFDLRTSDTTRKKQEEAAKQLELQMRRQARDNELESRRSLANDDLLGQSVFEAVGVDHSIAAVERRAQWRSLRSLEL